MRVALVIGHGPARDEGAVSLGGSLTELAYNRRLVPMIAGLLEGTRVEPVVVHRVTERVQPVSETNATGAECAIEFHLNSASSPSATGSEMVYCPGSKRGVAFARLLQGHVVAALGRADRGVKTPWQGRGLGWLQKTRMPAVMAESFFISNEGDVAAGMERMEVLARAYALGIAHWLTAEPSEFGVRSSAFGVPR